MPTTVKCDCHKVLFDGRVLLSRVTIFDRGVAHIKCPNCKRITVTGLIRADIGGENEEDNIYRE